MLTNRFLKKTLFSGMLMANFSIQAQQKTTDSISPIPNEVKIFVSNNSDNNLTIEEAYQRFSGPQEINLERSFLNIAKLFDNKVSYKNATRLLGTYHLASNGKFTADNSIMYHFEGAQLNEKSITNLAAGSDYLYNQDSILAFFVSNDAQSPSLSIKVDFKKHNFKIKELDVFITQQAALKKLPQELAKTGYSIEIKGAKNAPRFQDARVQSLEMIVGSGKDASGQLALEQIKKVFAGDVVIAQAGKGYLIYRDGRHELIEKRADTSAQGQAAQ